MLMIIFNLLNEIFCYIIWHTREKQEDKREN